MGKRKRAAPEGSISAAAPTSLNLTSSRSSRAISSPTKRHTSTSCAQPPPALIDADPQSNPDVQDARSALRASPDAHGKGEEFVPVTSRGTKSVKKRISKPSEVGIQSQDQESDSSLTEISDMEEPPVGKTKPVAKSARGKKSTVKEDNENREDPEVDDDGEAADPEELKEAMMRPPAVNSSYLPLPWKGRLGYCCLNTYLRLASPPVFSSRTCRIASILEHRHPLKDPTQPEHPTKNRPDKEQPADVARGQAYVEALGIANAKDIPKMLRWNDKYNIKFFRLSSEMFPFASHDVYGYKLAPFASEVLAEAGKVAAELGHRLTTHPGQFTQLGSPRPEVITASFRDLDYHCELLDLLKLPPQQDRDAVMILHMGGIFGDKAATIQRFKENYQKLPQRIKNRLVLENDDVCYHVHDLLPVCEELNIPLVLDFHHNNIVFDPEHLREGTLDIMNLYDRIKATWDRKGITQKMHYSEPCAGAVTGRQRRKHNARVYSLPPCAPDMDLMIEAKDKEQAVFEVMRNLKLPGFEKLNEMVPYTRFDENKPWKPPKKKVSKKKDAEVEGDDEAEPQPPPMIPEEQVSMGGPDNRVYWPPGLEEWLRPKKKEVKPRDPVKAKSTAERAAQRRAEKAAWQAAREASADVDGSAKVMATDTASASELGEMPHIDTQTTKSVYDQAKTKKQRPARSAAKKVKNPKAAVLTPSTSDYDDSHADEDVTMPDLTDAEEPKIGSISHPSRLGGPRRQSPRGTKRKAVNYAVDANED